jgi:hypothetical protein
VSGYGIQSVEKHPEYDNVIKVTNQDGSYLSYLRLQTGVLVPGSIWVQFHGVHAVHLFNPLGQGEIPTVLNVEMRA